jgi:hypothetical protein
MYNKDILLKNKEKIEKIIEKVEFFIDSVKDKNKKEEAKIILKKQKNILHGINISLQTVEFYK